MAEIRFQLLKQANGQPALDTLSGSGLAFYGATAGSSVQIGAYQGTTYVANSTGSTYKDETNNIKYLSSTFPSGQTNIAGAFGTAANIGLSGVKTFQGTLGIEFGHTAAVKVQNCQLRIYDRASVNYPASGVNTKLAEIANHNGTSFSSQGSAGTTSNAVGSGDILWWGEPWPAQLVTKNYYTNSAGVVFYNGLDSSSNTNGDSRLASAAVAGSYDTVGGTGIVMPLLDSPGSGQKHLQSSEIVSGSGMAWPKWTQYLTNTSNQSTFFGGTYVQFGDGSVTTKTDGIAPIDRTFGGTGVATHHTWSVAISAAPLSTGSKEQYGMYVSLEYL
tara:strand:- start:394 stop:1386 length:993 start_codon:yes stop_codon:yes gene_type:complete